MHSLILIVFLNSENEVGQNDQFALPVANFYSLRLLLPGSCTRFILQKYARRRRACLPPEIGAVVSHSGQFLQEKLSRHKLCAPFRFHYRGHMFVHVLGEISHRLPNLESARSSKSPYGYKMRLPPGAKTPRSFCFGLVNHVAVRAHRGCPSSPFAIRRVASTLKASETAG